MIKNIKYLMLMLSMLWMNLRADSYDATCKNFNVDLREGHRPSSHDSIVSHWRQACSEECQRKGYTKKYNAKITETGGQYSAKCCCE